MATPTTANLSRPTAFGYGVTLDSTHYRLAAGRATIETAPIEAPRVNTTSSPEEAAAEFGLTFARSQFDGGEGLFRAHTEGASPARFWDSRNVQVSPAAPGEFPEVSLLHTTAVIESSTDSNLWTALDATSGALFMAEGTTIRRCDDPLASTPSFSTDDPHNGESATSVGGVAILGNEVFAALGANGIHRKSGGSWAHWSDVQADRVWVVKGRVVAYAGASLYEVTTSGAAPSPLKTLGSGVTWTAVADGGSHILAAATDGYVYAFGTDTGSMVLEAQTLFEGEQPQAIGQSQGVVAVGTCQATPSGCIGRLYVGSLATNGQVADLQLVRQWGDADTTVLEYPRRIVGTRSALFTAVQDGADTYLWRYDLTTGGMARHLTISGESGLVRGIHAIGGRMFATVDGAGLYRETQTYADEGWLIGPLGDFYSAADKSWVGARIDTGAFVAGSTVELWYSTNPEALSDPDDDEWTRIVSRTTATAGTGELPLSDVTGRQLAGMVRLRPDLAGAASPKVRSFSFRAFQAAGDEDVIITLPINVSDQIERRGRHRMRVSGLGERVYSSLKDYEGRPVLLRLYRPDELVRGLVEHVGTPVVSRARRGSVTLVSEVRVRGKRVSSTGTAAGGGAFGTYRTFGTTPSFGKVAS